MKLLSVTILMKKVMFLLAELEKRNVMWSRLVVSFIVSLHLVIKKSQPSKTWIFSLLFLPRLDILSSTMEFWELTSEANEFT